MAANAVGKSKISFEIRLPHVVGLLFFKALDMSRRQTCVLGDEMVARKDVVERACTGQILTSSVFHDFTELFRAQRRVLLPQLNDARLHLR